MGWGKYEATLFTIKHAYLTETKMNKWMKEWRDKWKNDLKSKEKMNEQFQ